MIQFSHPAPRKHLPQRTRDKYLRKTAEWWSSKRHPESVTKSRGPFDRGQAMPGTSGPGIATYLTNSNVVSCFHSQPTSWWKPTFDAMLPPDVTDERSDSRTSDVGTGCPSDGDLQRADGCGRIVLSSSENGTRIEDVFERSPIRIMFPRTEHRAVEEAVLINTAGGIAGGDRLESGVTALADASIAVTSQAAEKIYRALNEPARIATKLKACEGAKLAWLPQETIVFNWGRVSRETDVELSSGAELLALEWLVFGRSAHGEQMVGGYITDRWRVKIDGRLVWVDTFRVMEEAFPHLHRAALLSNCRALGTLIYFGPHLDMRLEFLRGIAPFLGCHCAVTLVAGLLVVRFAATVSSDLRLALRGILQQFGRELGPGPFRVPKMWSC